MQAGKAKQQTEIASEKEQLQLAMISLKFEDKKDLLGRKIALQSILDKLFGRNETMAFVNDDSYYVKIVSSNRMYYIDEKGEINQETSLVQASKNFNNQLSDISYGVSNAKPYEINSIEDLLDLSYKVNGIEIMNNELTYTNNYNTFENNYFKLLSNLNFQNELSYENGMRTDYGDINGNGRIESLLVELTTGKGWTCIGGYGNTKNLYGFMGIFDGNDKEIKSLYINSEELVSTAGLFGKTFGGSISSLNLRGKIYCNAKDVGGIVGHANGSNELKVLNCSFNGSIENLHIEGSTGGIIGASSNQQFNISNSYMKGKIIAHNTKQFAPSAAGFGVGGIIGVAGNGEIRDSFNEANIIADNRVGGIVGNGASKVLNCYNKGRIEGNYAVGGISGFGSFNIEKCYNSGNIIAVNAGGGIAGISGSNNGKIFQCYNEKEGNVRVKNENASNCAGILGSIYASDNFMVEKCYNLANITGGVRTCGIVGSISGSNAKIVNCYNIGSITGYSNTNAIAGIARRASVAKGSTAKIISCYNIGILSNGAIKGISDIDKIYNSFYLSTCGATDDSQNKSKTDSELKGIKDILDQVFSINDEENSVEIIEEDQQNVWNKDIENINQGYPILNWQNT